MLYDIAKFQKICSFPCVCACVSMCMFVHTDMHALCMCGGQKLSLGVLAAILLIW